MSVLLHLVAYAAALLILLLAVSMGLTGNWGRAALLLLAALAVSPVSASALQLGPMTRTLAAAGLIGLFAWITLGETHTSIYDSPETRARFHALYAAELAAWPVPYESRFVDTDYGPVHVIVNGPEDGPPMLLLHASGVSGWSWKYNVADLSGPYRTFAIDLIGDAGLSEYDDLSHRLETGRDEADLYAAIMDALGVDRAIVVGASEGGFIATNLALYHPDRVQRLILLGPMGYSGATQAIIRIALTQLFPIRALQDATFRWAFSDDAALARDYAEWFPLSMAHVFPVKVAPFPFSAEERRAVSVPVHFVFGTRDNLVGDPARARARVADMKNATAEIVEAGHLMAAERPEIVTPIVLRLAAAGGAS